MRGFTGNFTKQADDHRRYSTALFSVLTDWKGTLQFHLHKISISAARAEKFTSLRTNHSLQTQNSIALYFFFCQNNSKWMLLKQSLNHFRSSTKLRFKLPRQNSPQWQKLRSGSASSISVGFFRQQCFWFTNEIATLELQTRVRMLVPTAIYVLDDASFWFKRSAPVEHHC